MKMRKLIAVMLALVLAFGLLPSMALADGLTVTVGVTNNSMTYGETAAITVVGHSEGATLTYSVTNDSVAEIVETEEGTVQVKATGVGKFQVRVTDVEGTLSGESDEITVSAATLTIPPDAITYNGKINYTVNAQGVDNEVVPVAITTSSSNVGKYTYTYSAAATEGTYTATCSDSNYTIAASGNGTFRITTRNLGEAEITLEEDSFTYDNIEKAVTINSVYLQNGNYNLQKDKDYQVISGATGKELGEYTLTIQGIGNYAGTASTYWSIVAPTPTYTAPAANTLTYNGLDQELVTAGLSSEQGCHIHLQHGRNQLL